jgi:hypothetical protein
VSNRRLIAIALLAVSPALAEAQFTTFIPPKNKVADSVKAVVAAVQKAEADTALRLRLTNMKTWVDSAAGVVPTPTSRADSLTAGLPTPGMSAPGLSAPGTIAADTLAMRNGSRAPATASMLPLIALVGGTTLLLGALLLGRKRPARARA